METQPAAVTKPANPAYGFTVSTADVAPRDRREWLQDVIRREYTRVEVTPPRDGQLFNEMTFYEWEKLRLSVVHSNALVLNRLAH